MLSMTNVPEYFTNGHCPWINKRTYKIIQGVLLGKTVTDVSRRKTMGGEAKVTHS
jgi:hypothetical protein